MHQDLETQQRQSHITVFRFTFKEICSTLTHQKIFVCFYKYFLNQNVPKLLNVTILSLLYSSIII